MGLSSHFSSSSDEESNKYEVIVATTELNGKQCSFENCHNNPCLRLHYHKGSKKRGAERRIAEKKSRTGKPPILKLCPHPIVCDDCPTAEHFHMLKNLVLPGDREQKGDDKAVMDELVEEYYSGEAYVPCAPCRNGKVLLAPNNNPRVVKQPSIPLVEEWHEVRSKKEKRRVNKEKTSVVSDVSNFSSSTAFLATSNLSPRDTISTDENHTSDSDEDTVGFISESFHTEDVIGDSTGLVSEEHIENVSVGCQLDESEAPLDLTTKMCRLYLDFDEASRRQYVSFGNQLRYALRKVYTTTLCDNRHVHPDDPSMPMNLRMLTQTYTEHRPVLLLRLLGFKTYKTHETTENDLISGIFNASKEVMVYTTLYDFLMMEVGDLAAGSYEGTLYTWTSTRISNLVRTSEPRWFLPQHHDITVNTIGVITNLLVFRQIKLRKTTPSRILADATRTTRVEGIATYGINFR